MLRITQFLVNMLFGIELLFLRIAARFGYVPAEYWQYHHEDCSTKYRGCSPECPKDIYERTGKWRP